MNIANDSSFTIARLAPLIRRRSLSPVELADFVLARIERLQPTLNAFITTTADLARAQAKQSEQEIAGGNYRGPLHGIPICIKDLFYTRGIRTTAGSRILRSFKPRENSCVVDRLLAAGVTLVGKTNLHEFAFGATNVNPHFGAVHNPWAPGRISGGSSGGTAAAVTAALAVAGLGTDTGGSVRIPAAACGCVGLKPTYGRVPLHGVIPLASTLDHVGPLCRCVRDAAIVLGAIGGMDRRDPASVGKPGESFTRDLDKGAGGLRIGVPKQYFFNRIQTDVRRSVLEALNVLAKSGAELHEINLRGMDETAELAAEITVAEALAYHGEWLEKRPGDYGADIRSRLEASKALPAVTYIRAQQRRTEYRRRFLESMENVDVVAAPTLPVTAPEIESREVQTGRSLEDVRLALLRLTRPGNLTGFPAITVPCGFSADGLPIGLQILGRPLDEAAVLRVAYSYEAATRWHERFPSETGASVPETITRRGLK